MKTCEDCIPCFVRQAVDTGRMATNDPQTRTAILRKTLRVLAEAPYDVSPPVISIEAHRIIRELSGVTDPYAEQKRSDTEHALSLLPVFREKVESDADPFAAAVRCALAGNVIDFGIAECHAGIDLAATIDEALHISLGIDHIRQLREAAESAVTILYLLDNAGEVVLDRLLIERIGPAKITAVVRGGPIINDVTYDDAALAGIPDLVPVIENGVQAPGSPLERCNDAFRAALHEADLVIAKGQGNYETLEDVGRHSIFFLLKAKCPVVANHLGCKLGDLVVKQG